MNKNPATAMPATPSNTEPDDISRRDFLGLGWKGLLGLTGFLGLAGLWKYISYQPDPAPPTTFDLGPVDNFPPGVRARIPEANAVVVYPEGGLAAMSLVCPHLGCVVDLAKDGYACPCHGSRFNLEGAVKHGPADQPMKLLRLEVRQDDGHLILHTDV